MMGAYTGVCLGITGHRPDKLDGYHDTSSQCYPIKHKMELFFVEKNPVRIVSGMALGTDQWAVEVALKLDVKVLALIPCLNQGQMWPYQAQRHYQDLLEQIERKGGKVEYVTLKPYEPSCMHRRNMEIVNNSNEMLAVWDGSKGGTKDCVKFARNQGLPITILNPRTMEFENDSRESSIRGTNDTVSEMAEEVGPEISSIS